MEAVNSEQPTRYNVDTPEDVTQWADDIIAQAREIILGRWHAGELIDEPKKSFKYLQILIGHYEHEVFGVVWLDNRSRVLGWEEMFRGTVDGASVYPREVVKSALKHNAAAAILAHNHPSGNAEPSQADIRITGDLKAALKLVDVRVLDHIIVGEQGTSLAERGLL